jgi:hypothetical protein
LERVINPLNPGIRSKAAVEVRAAATDREEMKLKKYKDFAKENNVTVIPFAIETFGGFGNMALSFVERLSNFVAANKGTLKKTEKKYIMQRLSFLCQRKNANMILARKFG